MIKVLLAILISSFSALAIADDSQWNPRFTDDGISIHTRTVNGETHLEFRAVTRVDASMAQIISLLQDNEACTRWLHQCESSRILNQVSNEERFFYQVSNLPFPAKSRDAIFHARVSYGPDQAVRISMESAPDYLPETKKVRINKAYGEYLLEPGAEGQIQLTWTMFIDPAGALPAWIVNSMLTDLPFKSLRAFRTLVAQAPYNTAVFKYDEQGIPVDIVFSEN